MDGGEPMRFKGLDLNLLIAFEVLLETRSVSRAAERMNLSQAAMSSALGRLREYFGDEILVERVKLLRSAEQTGTYDQVFSANNNR